MNCTPVVALRRRQNTPIIRERRMARCVRLVLVVAWRVAGTSLEDALPSCFDPAGVACTCSGYIYLKSDLTGTIPAALGSCSSLTKMCGASPSLIRA